MSCSNHKRTVSMGVAMEEVEEARDSKSPKKNLIGLIVARAAAAAGAPAGLGRSGCDCTVR
eukprot:COSAG06_NODE_20630_length_787_cov_1.393895_1_plen_61_part_00